MADEKSLSLLLVDDNAGDADLVREYLSQIPGYDIVFQYAPSFSAATEALRFHPVDLIVLDLGLPECSGVETLRRMRNAASHLPIVVFTGSANDEALRRVMLDEGATDLIGKDEPVSRHFARSVLSAIERHRAAEFQSRMERLVSSLPDAVVVTDPRGQIQFVNRAAEAILDQRRKDLIQEAIVEAAADGAPREIEFLDGPRRRWAEMRVVPVDWDGQPACLASIRDITENKALAEQLNQSQKLEAIGRLAGGIAHDFNNLLTVIANSATFVRDEMLPGDPGTRDLATVLRATEQATALTRQLLAYSRRQPIQPQVVNLNEIVSGMERMLLRLFAEDIDIVLSCADGLAPVFVDFHQFEQVVMNLALNARDAMPRGGRLSIETRNGPVPLESIGEYVELAVADNGCGMTDQVKAHLFEPFFTTKLVGKGTGLGLAMVHGLVAQAGGLVEVESAVGKGSRFVIRLPTAKDREPAPAPAPANVEVRRGKETILVVEDVEMLRHVAARLLALNGYTVLQAANGADALELTARYEGGIDLALVDVVMPVMNGPEAAEELLKRFPRLKILMMSGYTSDILIDHGATGRKHPMLNKPFARNELLTRVRQLLDRD